MQKSTLKLTPFESEIVDSLLWQVEGFKAGRVTRRATTRIMRATIRRIKPRLVARSQAAVAAKHEVDHAIPVREVCERILNEPNLDRAGLLNIIAEWLVSVQLSPEEHQALLKCGFADCMPEDWDKVDPLARYQAAGIVLSKLPAQDE